MTMSNDDIIMPNRSRSERPSQGPFRERAPGRGPVIDQEGHLFGERMRSKEAVAAFKAFFNRKKG